MTAPIHFTTASGSLLCRIAFGPDEAQRKMEKLMEERRAAFAQYDELRRYSGAPELEVGFRMKRQALMAKASELSELSAQIDSLRPATTVVYAHTTCGECRVGASWALEACVKFTFEWFRFGNRGAHRIAKELGIKPTKRDGYWSLRLQVFDGRSLSMKLQMAGRPLGRRVA